MLKCIYCDYSIDISGIKNLEPIAKMMVHYCFYHPDTRLGEELSKSLSKSIK